MKIVKIIDITGVDIYIISHVSTKFLGNFQVEQN
jgi:hypothetical protein